MLRFAWKSIWRDRLRFGITVGGVAMAVLLILTMNGIFAGAGRQITAYIDFSNADLFVAQEGVRNMHMATSALPTDVLPAVAAVPGVERAEGISYFPSSVEWQGEKESVYVIGITEEATLGVPWSMAAGRDRPGRGEVIIPDRQWGWDTPGPGGTVLVGGQAKTVAGVSLGTKILASSILFMNHEETTAMRGPGHLNYVLVKVSPGAEAKRVATQIQADVPGLTVITRQTMSSSDYEIAIEMGADILRIMALVGFVIGLAVVTLTVYVATVEQIRQYGVLKAVGAGPGHLFIGILGQAMAASVIGFVTGVAATALVGWLVPKISAGLDVDLSLLYSGKVLALVLLMSLIAAFPPFLRVQRVDPMDIFRA